MEPNPKLYAFGAERFFFRLNMLVLLSIVGNIYYLLAWSMSPGSQLSKFYLLINVVTILILCGVAAAHFRLKFKSLFTYGLICAIVFPPLNSIISIEAFNVYTELSNEPTNQENIKTNQEVESIYGICKTDCAHTERLIGMGFQEKRHYYSWKAAQIKGILDLGWMFGLDNNCCVNESRYYSPWDYIYLLGTFFILERTFEFFPILIVLALLCSLLEYYRKKPMAFLTEDWIGHTQFDVRKINIFGLILIILIVLYNIHYMNSI